MLIPALLISCINNKSSVNTYTFIINIDSIEFYNHPLENKNNLKSIPLSILNIKDVIKKNKITKEDTILIKMIESADCIPKAANLEYLFKKEGLSNILLKKFDYNDEYILGYKNFILFDTNRKMQLSIPIDAEK